MNTEILNEIGLSESEKKVYLTLLSLGDSTRGDIVNKSGVTGSKVYELLEKLQDKGLVSIYIQDNIKHFKPTNPKQILNFLEKKKEKIIELEKQTNLFLPNLLLQYGSSKKDQEVELLKGLKGLEVIFREQVELLKKDDICYVIGGTKGSNEETIQNFFEKIHLMRERKQIKTKMLYSLKQKEIIKKIYSSKNYPHTTTKFIEHTSPVAINIFKNITVIIIFGEEINSIYIKSEEVANSFMEYFKILWKIAEQ